MKSDRCCRRAFLQALGLGAGFLPLLDSKTAPGAPPGGYPTRLVTITWTNGTIPEQFYPPVGMLSEALPPLLAPLEPYKSKMLFLRGADAQRGAIDVQVMLDQELPYSGHYSYPALLTGTYRDGVSEGPSIDQLIADDLAAKGVPSKLLNLGVRPGSSSTSWKAAGQKNTLETDPYRVFNRLFAGVPSLPDAPEQTEALVGRRQAVLDFVGSELEQFGARLGSDDRSKVQSHLEAIRELQTRLTSPSAELAGCAPPSLPMDRPDFDDVRNYPTHVSEILALAGAALKCDFARCITIDLVDDGGGNTLSFPWLGLEGADYHSIAHDVPSDGPESKAAIDRWFFEQVAQFVADLANTAEGEASLLDNTCILIANDMNEGATHYVGELPFLLIGSAGGFFKQGESLSLSSNVPNNLLLVSLCHAMGLDISSVGSSYEGDLDATLRA